MIFQSYFKAQKFNKSHKISILFWSEAKYYWNTFFPLLDYFSKNEIPFFYFASDKDDEGLVFCENSLYIGNGKKAYQFLNYIQADIVIMTTPGLGDLAIKRSRKVKYYVHIVHAPTDIHLYRRASFECFDYIFCSGSHQINTIRALEKIRGTESKKLLETGCLYFDKMVKGKSNNLCDKKTILIAPTWGKNGALHIGKKLILPLLENDFKVIIRPHPQSLKNEKFLINNLKAELKDFSNLIWDNDINPDLSMSKSSVMISDVSGVIFDYCFVYRKPVICINREIQLKDLEATDLDFLAWEIYMREKLGKTIKVENISQIVSITKSLIGKQISENLVEDSVYNFGRAGEVAAKQILEIYQSLKS